MSKHLFFFFLSPILAAYQHTDNMAYLLVAFGQFAHRKITAKIMCTVQLLQHLILRCAQRMCTAHNKYVQVMHMTYRQAGCYQAKIVLKKNNDKTCSRLRHGNPNSTDLPKGTLLKVFTLKPCERIWLQTCVHRVLAENTDLRKFCTCFKTNCCIKKIKKKEWWK